MSACTGCRHFPRYQFMEQSLRTGLQPELANKLVTPVQQTFAGLGPMLAGALLLIERRQQKEQLSWLLLARGEHEGSSHLDGVCGRGRGPNLACSPWS